MEKTKLEYWDPNTFEKSEVEYSVHQQEIAECINKKLKEVFEKDNEDGSYIRTTGVVISADTHELKLGVMYRYPNHKEIEEPVEKYVITISQMKPEIK